MKGIIIYEDYRGKEVVEAIKLDTVNYKCTSDDDWISELSGIRKESTQAWCNKDDTYDFETGALIALMKMCGFDKSYKAIEEAFKYNSYDAKKTKELEEENIKLKKRINELEVYNNQLEDRVAAEQRGGYKLLKDMEKLQHDYDLCLNSENALKYTVDSLNKSVDKLNKAIYGYKNDLYNTAKRCNELEKENEKLKLDCEKLQHGYNDMIFCGGRQNGKQYTLLVDLFKKIDQKKVDEEWLYGPPTKREEMWENILGASKCPPVEIKVAKEDVTSFLRELQDKIPEARWNGSDCPPVELSVPDWFKHDYIYFALFRNDDKGNLRMCYDNKPHSWINKSVIEYIAPMRWDLFEKGRKIVRVTPENIDEFIVKCTNKFSSIMKPVLKRYKDFTHAFIMISDYHYDNKPTIHIMTPEDLVRNQHENPKKYSDKKIVDWEDVR